MNTEQMFQWMQSQAPRRRGRSATLQTDDPNYGFAHEEDHPPSPRRRRRSPNVRAIEDIEGDDR